MYEISLLLESKDVPASNGGTFDRLNPVTGDVASRAAAAQIADAKRAADTAAAAFPAWSATGPNARRAILLKAADLAGVEGAAIHRADGGRDRRDRRLGRLQRPPRRRHAARGGRHDHADFRRSHPLGQAGLHRDGRPPARGRGAEHGAVERAGHPRRARHRDAAGLRQHRGAEGLRNLPGHASADRRMPARRRPAAGRPQRHHQRAGRRAGPDRNADRPSRRAPGQLHRLDAGRPHHRAGRGKISQAGAARTRRQGADDRARRCRYRRGGGRGGVRRLHEPGPDLHVDRAHRRRREDRRRVRDQARGESRIAGRRRSPQGQCAAGIA